MESVTPIPATGMVPVAALLDLARKFAADPLPTPEELGERARHIAGIRELADWLEANPFVPMPWRTEGMEHLTPGQDVPDGAAGVAMVRGVAERLGVLVDDLCGDRTKLLVPFGDGKVSYELIAWHKDGRPAEPAPEPHPSWPTESELKPWESLAPAADRLAESVKPIDPDSSMTGLHIEAATSPTGLTKAADESRGPLAFTTPVVTYFSFGHGQTDPDSGKRLIDHYVTVVAPTYGACREAMFASRFGDRWSFDYLAGRSATTEAVSEWTEHEVILAPGLDAADAVRALAAAVAVLAGDEPVSEAR